MPHKSGMNSPLSADRGNDFQTRSRDLYQCRRIKLGGKFTPRKQPLPAGIFIIVAYHVSAVYSKLFIQTFHPDFSSADHAAVRIWTKKRCFITLLQNSR